MKWALAIGGSILVLALIGSGLFNFAKGLMKGENTPKPIPTTSTTDRSTSSPSPIVTSISKNECLDLSTRMAQAKIDTKQVDKVFYQKYPDLLKQRWRERTNKALGDTQLDRNLRQEWCAIGNRLSNTQPPNTVR